MIIVIIDFKRHEKQHFWILCWPSLRSPLISFDVFNSNPRIQIKWLFTTIVLIFIDIWYDAVFDDFLSVVSVALSFWLIGWIVNGSNYNSHRSSNTNQSSHVAYLWCDEQGSLYRDSRIVPISSSCCRYICWRGSFGIMKD